MIDGCIELAVLVSGNGTNLQAIIDQSNAGKLAARVTVVISDREDAFALERARRQNITAIFVNPRDFVSRRQFDKQLSTELDRLQPDLIVLAGFMRILSANFVNRYPNRIMNIHPSLLPNYKGLNTHQRVLQAREHRHGATVHFVSPELDSGSIIVQKGFDVLPTDTVEQLERRVHECEYEIYPSAIQMFANGELADLDH